MYQQSPKRPAPGATANLVPPPLVLDAPFRCTAMSPPTIDVPSVADRVHQPAGGQGELDMLEAEWARVSGLSARPDVSTFDGFPGWQTAWPDHHSAKPTSNGSSLNDQHDGDHAQPQSDQTLHFAPGVYCFALPGLDNQSIRQRSQSVENTAQLAAKIFAWAPSGMPAGKRIGLLSSRVGRRPQDDEGWLRSLRYMDQRLSRSQHTVLVSSPHMTCDMAAQRISARYQKPLLCIFTPTDKPAGDWIAKWQAGATLNRPRKRHQTTDAPLRYPLIVWSTSVGIAKSRDLLTAIFADDIFVLKIRPRGNVQHLMPYLSKWNKRVYTFPSADAVGRRPGDIPDRDTIPIILFPATRSGDPSNPPNRSKRPGQPTGTLPVSLRQWKTVNEPFLFHWTRPRMGAWPDQSPEEFWDELLSNLPIGDWGPCDALTRILRHERILATNRLIRGRHRVVSFTAIPLEQFPRRRVFRGHLARWDFAPFGIGLKRSTLESMGARPVVYGDEATWHELSESDRPFFQRRASRLPSVQDRNPNRSLKRHPLTEPETDTPTPAHGAASRKRSPPIDWSAEREWRIVGDIDLKKVDRASAVVFVPDREAAEFYAAISRWPVVYLSEDPTDRRPVTMPG